MRYSGFSRSGRLAAQVSASTATAAGASIDTRLQRRRRSRITMRVGLHAVNMTQQFRSSWRPPDRPQQTRSRRVRSPAFDRFRPTSPAPAGARGSFAALAAGIDRHRRASGRYSGSTLAVGTNGRGHDIDRYRDNTLAAAARIRPRSADVSISCYRRRAGAREPPTRD